MKGGSHLKQFFNRHKSNILFVIIAILIFISFIISFIWPFIPEEEKVEEDTSIKLEPSKEKEEKEKTTEILVDIKGQIKSPGVYKMNAEERVNDVIKKAGGLTNLADTSMINLSQKVKDEMVIIIYSKKEVEEMNKKEPCVCPENNDACIKEENNIVTKNKETQKTNDKISINKATKEELMTLDGIGEAKAESILEYRKEKGDFEKTEDIKEVSGIGDALYEKIKNKITL